MITFRTAQGVTFGMMAATFLLTGMTGSAAICAGCQPHLSPRQQLEAQAHQANGQSRQGRPGSSIVEGMIKAFYDSYELKTPLSTTTYKTLGVGAGGDAYSVRYIEFTHGRGGELVNDRQMIDDVKVTDDFWDHYSKQSGSPLNIHNSDLKVIASREQVAAAKPSTLIANGKGIINIKKLVKASPASVKSLLGLPIHEQINGGQFGTWRDYHKNDEEQIRVNYVNNHAVKMEIIMRVNKPIVEPTMAQAVQIFGLNVPAKKPTPSSPLEVGWDGDAVAPFSVVFVNLEYHDNVPYYKISYFLPGAHIS